MEISYHIPNGTAVTIWTIWEINLPEIQACIKYIAKALSYPSTVYAMLVRTYWSCCCFISGPTWSSSSIVSYIAFIRHPSPSLLTELEEVINSADNHLDPLLLAYGALASETTEESEQRIVTFLLNRMEDAPRSAMTMVHYSYSCTRKHWISLRIGHYRLLSQPQWPWSSACLH